MEFKELPLKRIAVILFSILYLIPAVGVSLDLHKCGKKIKVIAVNAPHGAKCPCGTDMPFDCCKDIHLSVQIKDEQKTSEAIIVSHTGYFNLIAIPVELSIGAPSSQVEVFDFTSYHAPPFKSKQPVYLTNSIFRI